MKCTKCGADILPDDVFCGNCGAAVQPADSGEKQEDASFAPDYDLFLYEPSVKPTDVTGKKSKSKTIAAVGLIAILVFLLLFTVFNTVIMTGLLNIPEDSFLDDYRQSLSSLLGMEEHNKPESEPDETKRETEATWQSEVETSAPILYDEYKDEYLFLSDRQLLTEDYLDSKSKNEIDLIRNEIYARHGYIFKIEKYYNYFIQKSWYHPTEPDMNKAYESFNSTEKQNIEILTRYQNLM